MPTVSKQQHPASVPSPEHARGALLVEGLAAHRLLKQTALCYPLRAGCLGAPKMFAGEIVDMDVSVFDAMI